MATKIRVTYRTRDVMTWQSPILTLADFGLDEDDTDEVVRSRVFHRMNAIDGDPDFEVCVRLRVHSMMVGDDVVIDRGCCSRAFRVEPVGWSEVV